jgi:hypothetical protein
MALTKIDDRGVTYPLDLLDNEKIRFGTGNDLEAYHSSSDNNSYIQHTQNGTSLIVKSDYFIVAENQSTDVVMRAAAGTAELYYNNNKKLETYASGCYVYGKVALQGSEDGNAIIEMFADEGDDTADKYQLASITNGNWEVQNYSSGSAWETNIRATGGGLVSLYYDDAKKIETTSVGALVTGKLELTGNLVGLTGAFFADSNKASFGTGDDLEIYHDGTDARFHNTTGRIINRTATNAGFYNSAGSESLAIFTVNGSCELYYDNSKKFESLSGGAQVTGSFGLNTVPNRHLHLHDTSANTQVLMQVSNATTGTANGDGFHIGINSSQEALIQNKEDTNLTIYTGGETSIKCVNDGAVELYYDDSKKFETTSTGVKIESSSATELKLTSSTSSSASIEFGDTDDDDEAQIWYDNYGKTLNFRTSEASDLVFYRDGTERTRITSTGTETAGYNKSFLVKSDSAFGSTSAHVIQSNNNNQVATIIEHSGDTNPYGLMISFSDDDPDDNSHYFLKCEDGSNTNRLFIYSDGDVWNHDNSYTGSDQTLKENIVDATPKLEDLKKLKVRNFNWKAEYFPGKSKKKQLGFIAQEVEEVFPALVSEHDIAAGTPNDGHVPLIKKAIKQAWDPIIIKAMQELIEKVETLETEVAALKAK